MKKLLVFFVTILVFLCMEIMVFAVPPSDINPASVTEIDKTGGVIINVIQTAAIVVAVSSLLFVGIRFMTAAPAEKANIKGALIPYIVGTILIFSAVPILQVIQDLFM